MTQTMLAKAPLHLRMKIFHICLIIHYYNRCIDKKTKISCINFTVNTIYIKQEMSLLQTRQRRLELVEEHAEEMGGHSFYRRAPILSACSSTSSREGCSATASTAEPPKKQGKEEGGEEGVLRTALQDE
jgi:hypothetical protein